VKIARIVRVVGLLALVAAALGLGIARARADETSSLFDDATKALDDGRPGDAIANFEALGDRGVVDAVASFDRGLAYAARVRVGSSVPGDLGRAAHGFEEARALAIDPSLGREAASALAVVRAEVARRRALAGEPVDVDPGVSLARAVVELASEETWTGLALFSSALLTAALFVRWRTTAQRLRRLRIAAAIALAATSPLLLLTGVLAAAARDQRLHLREGVVVAESARLADDRHIVVAGASPLPEAARVTIEDSSGGWTRIRFGAARGWVPSSTVRPIARAE
jgi:hypothetical protein